LVAILGFAILLSFFDLKQNLDFDNLDLDCYSGGKNGRLFVIIGKNATIIEFK